MRLFTSKFLSVGLLVGIVVGCGKTGPDGLEGLCEKLIDCGANTTVADCSNAVAACPNVDAQADECLKNDDCGQVLACYTSILLTCVPVDGTTSAGGTETDSNADTTNPTETPSDTTGVVGPTTTTTPDSTTEIDTTATPSTSETTDPTVDPDTTSPATTDDTTTGVGAPDFGPCDMMTPCENGEECLGVQDVEGTFCSPACEGQGTECPGYEGSGMALCLLSVMGMDPTNCVVLCQSDADCLDGMTCKEVPDSMGAQICSAP